MSRAPRSSGALLSALTFCTLLASGRAAGASGPFSWAPSGDPAVARGKEVAERFGLRDAYEVSVEVTDAFGAAGRRAIAAAEEGLRRIPGVRRVAGAAGLLDLPAAGKAGVVSWLADRPGDEEGLVLRERMKRRADALGWFLSADGRAVRFLVETTGPAKLRDGVRDVVRAAGLPLAHPDAIRSAGTALWPTPDDAPVGWLRLLMLGLWVVAAVAFTARAGRLSATGVVLTGLAGAVAAGALLFFVDVTPVRIAGIRMAVVAGCLAAAAAVVARSVRPGAPPRVLVLALTGLGALAAVVALVMEPRLVIRTERWKHAPLMFASVRGDLEDPLVLREVRRMTDYLRAQPGVQHAWSVADLFPAFSGTGNESPRIPDDAAAVRAVLDLARGDAALALELAPDRREALVPIRLRDETAAREVLDRLSLYLRVELRSSMLAVSIADKTLPPVTRTFGKSVLAYDTKERVARICERHGRKLKEEDILSIDRVCKQAAFVQTADFRKLKVELVEEIAAFLVGPTVPPGGSGFDRGKLLADFRERAQSAASPPPEKPGSVARLVLDLWELPGDAKVEDVQRPLAIAFPGLAEKPLLAAAQELHARMAEVRRKHAAGINAREMLSSADLPPSGALADEVRGATLDAMAPVVGVPVEPDTPGAIHFDALAVGGVACDRALSAALGDGMRRGAVFGLIALAAILLAAAGLRGLAHLPIALLPLAVAVVVAAARERVGPTAPIVAATAFAVGALVAVTLAARRRSAGAPSPDTGPSPETQP